MKSTSHLKSTITPSARGAMRCPPLGRVFLFVAHLLGCVALAPVAQAVCPPPSAWATDVASYSFTANWSESSLAIGYRLDVSTSSSFSTYVPGYQNLNVGNATSRSVTGLNASTTYYYRVRRYCRNGKVGTSTTVQVITLSPTGPPVVITNRAIYIAGYSARLEGTVDPHGLPTTVYFQYGTTISYGLTTAIQSKTGNTYQDVAANISGLTASTTYHFRIVATNSAGTRYGADGTFTTLAQSSPTPTPTPTPTATPSVGTAMVADFNGDGHPDWVARNINTRQTALVYLNDYVVVGAAIGPTLDTNLRLTGAADFNVDTHPDYALFAPNTLQTTLWYLTGPSRIGTASGPTLPAGWELITTADFNGDNHPDFVIFKRSTRQTAIVFLNNNVVIGAALLPTLPAGWNLRAVADFNSDGHVDIALFNSNTRQTVIGYLSGTTLIGAVFGPVLTMNWQLVAAADFNGDGHPDYLLYRPDTRQIAIFYLNNNVLVTAVLFQTPLPAGWTLLSY